jgi:N-acetylneuraminate synthase
MTGIVRAGTHGAVGTGLSRLGVACAMQQSRAITTGVQHMSRAIHRANELFENLFVLELANNHWGSLTRGLKIVRDHGTVARYNGVKAAIKLQFRDVDHFIHKKFRGDQSVRYISKTEATKMSIEDFGTMVREVVSVGCIPMATPFDERSVDLCVQFDMPMIKVASSDINDWPLLERISRTKLPVIISSGGASEKELDDVVTFFENRNIPLAVNHCVSLYPSEDHQLELNQIDYLRDRYPGHVIGLSTHEYHDWEASMYMSYAKGARTWERHIDIDHDGVAVSPYCSLPEQVDTWFKAFRRAQSMSGGSADSRRVLPKDEIQYLDALVRGVYARRPLEPGYVFSKESFDEDLYLAVPLQKGQLSCREVMNGELLRNAIQPDEALTIDHIDGPYSENSALRAFIMDRGL